MGKNANISFSAQLCNCLRHKHRIASSYNKFASKAFSYLTFILGVSSADSGRRESLYGRKKRRPRRKVKNGVKNPWDNGETSSKQSSPFWLLIDVRKVLCFSLQSEGSRPWSRFVCKQSTLSLAVHHVYHGCSRRLYAQGERFSIRTKCQGKRSVNTLDLSALVVIKNSLFDSLRNIHRFTEQMQFRDFQTLPDF